MNPLLLLESGILRLLGVKPEALQKFDEAQLLLGGSLKPAAAVLIFALGAVWFGWLYYKDGTKPGWAIKFPLLLLRLTALASLLAILFQPTLRLRKREEVKPAAVLLVDRSQSMEERDSRLPRDRASALAAAFGATIQGASRLQIAERILSGERGLVTAAGRKNTVRLYGFAGETAPLPSGRITADPKTGGSTQIGGAIKRALEDTAGQPIAGALILSDGGHNLGEDPVAAAQIARQQGLLISTVGIGDPTPTKDIAITDVLHDQVVRKENVTQVFVGVSHRGYSGRNVSVVLKRGNAEVGRQRLQLGADNRRQTATFTFTPMQAGEFPYSAEVDTAPDELTAQNNTRRFVQKVISRRLKVLYVEGDPRWEYRYLKNAVLRDKQIAFSCYLVSSGLSQGGEGNVPVFKFPTDEKTLFDFDIIILGDVPRRHFSETQLRLIRRFVEDKGSSLVVIAGEKHMPWEYRGSVLEPVLPVVIPAVPEQVVTFQPFHWELTPEGRLDPLMRMDEAPDVNARIWDEMPGMFWHAGVPRAKPGATVLVVNRDRSNSAGKRVVTALQKFGAGRCLMNLADSTWRWRYRVGDRYFYRFWGQVIRSMTPQETPGGNRFAQISVDRNEVLLGERVTISARMLDAFYRPVKDKNITAQLVGETGGTQTISLSAVPGSPGLFTLEIPADRVGKFTLKAASPASPKTPAQTAFVVQSVALEKQQPELQEALLKRIAAAGGGRYYRPEEAAKWLETLKAEPLPVRTEEERELWDAPLLLTIFVTVLAAEWVVRKRCGLL